MNPFVISFSSKVSTTSDSFKADCRVFFVSFFGVLFCSQVSPAKNPFGVLKRLGWLAYTATDLGHRLCE